MQFVAAAFSARTDHHVGFIGTNRRNEFGNVVRIVRTVGVDEDQDPARALGDRQAQRLAFAAAAVENDARSMVQRGFPSPVA